MYLSNYIVHFNDQIEDGLLNSPHELGNKLILYALSLSEEAAFDEKHQNLKKAQVKYNEALFVLKELHRDLSNALKYSEDQKNTHVSGGIAQSMVPDDQNSEIASFTFIH